MCVISLASLPPPKDHKDGCLVVSTFIWYFSIKAGRESCFCFFIGCTVWLGIFSVILQQTLCRSLRGRCAVVVFLRCDDTVARVLILYVAGYPIHQNQLWTNYFGHLTPGKLHSFIPVESLLYGTVHFGCSSFHHAVTSLCYAIPGWCICTTES